MNTKPDSTTISYSSNWLLPCQAEKSSTSGHSGMEGVSDAMKATNSSGEHLSGWFVGRKSGVRQTARRKPEAFGGFCQDAFAA